MCAPNTGGFYGSKDPKGVLLQKKRKMLEEEGVLFVNKRKLSTDTNKKRKIDELLHLRTSDAPVNTSGDTSLVKVSQDSLFHF
jgi:hypothetical protein